MLMTGTLMTNSHRCYGIAQLPSCFTGQHNEASLLNQSRAVRWSRIPNGLLGSFNRSAAAHMHKAAETVERERR